ncbi:MAG: hypothetical protein ICV54_31190 [Nostoc sp. C3-bin3]|nr:hypothetical protein [Nostoc sp. C3-bin3]
MLHQEIDQKISEKEAWALRRQLGIPNNKRLWVLACMDERLPIEKALGIGEGDAHIFHNAGGLVTDNAIRSAMLTTQFFGYKRLSDQVNTASAMKIKTTKHTEPILEIRSLIE